MQRRLPANVRSSIISCGPPNTDVEIRLGSRHSYFQYYSFGIKSIFVGMADRNYTFSGVSNSVSFFTKRCGNHIENNYSEGKAATLIIVQAHIDTTGLRICLLITNLLF